MRTQWLRLINMLQLREVAINNNKVIQLWKEREEEVKRIKTIKKSRTQYILGL